MHAHAALDAAATHSSFLLIFKTKIIH